jgi:porin
MVQTRGTRRIGAAALSVALTFGRAAIAAPPPVSIPVDPDSYQTGGANGGPFAFLDSWQRTNYLLGDMWGLRSWMSQYGFSLAIQETSEVLGNVTGGNRRGFDYDGLTTMILQGDTNRAFGWYGGTFDVSALDIHGRNLSADNLGTLQTASGIEADRGLRLWEFWYQQKFLDEDRLDIKIGQQSLDQEFIVSQNALLFVNTMFGWPMVPSADLPGGGPAYPLSALGVRIRAKPTNSITLLAGLFNGSPAPSANGDPQQADPSGTSFPTNGGKLAIAELQYAYPGLSGMVYPGESEPLARLYRLGVWYDTESFNDLRYDDSGLSLANPASTGNPLQHRHDYSIYAVADQMVWVWDRDTNRNLSVFARAMGTPQQDRNVVDLSLNVGFVLHQPLQYRNDDTFGIGMGYAHVSPRAAGLDRDMAAFTGSFTAIRSSETFVEATYQYQMAPWWQMQPDIQYVFNPGAGIASSTNTNARVGNELVLGMRTNIQF